MRIILNGKLKIIQNRTWKLEFESESEGKERDEQNENDFEMENTYTSEKNGYKPIHSSAEDEQNLHTDSEISTGENKNKYLITKSISVRILSREYKQPSRWGGTTYTKNVLEVIKSYSYLNISSSTESDSEVYRSHRN